MSECTIYALCDPHTGECRYVGKTIDVDGRFKKHLRDKHVSHKQCWISGLKKKGCAPVITVLQTVAGDGCAEEVLWIKHYRDAGADLTNLTEGGEGMPGYKFSAESKARLRDSHIGKKLSEAHVAGMRKAYALLDRTESQRKQLTDLHRRKIGVPRSPAVRVTLRQKCSGWKHTDEAKRSMSRKRRGVARNPSGVSAAVSTRETHRNGYDAFVNGKAVKSHVVFTPKDRA